jgi:hypothetical protein
MMGATRIGYRTAGLIGALSVALLVGTTASAALIHDYEFNGNLKIRSEGPR